MLIKNIFLLQFAKIRVNLLDSQDNFNFSISRSSHSEGRSDSGVNRNFMIISSLMSLVTIKEDIIILFQELQTVSFIPAFRVTIKAYLAANSKVHIEVHKLFFQSFFERFENFGSFVKFSEFVPFLLTAVAAHRGNIDKSSSIFNESASLDRNIQLCNIPETEFQKSF